MYVSSNLFSKRLAWEVDICRMKHVTLLSVRLKLSSYLKLNLRNHLSEALLVSFQSNIMWEYILASRRRMQVII